VILFLGIYVNAQESERQTVAINFKDSTKKAVIGTLVSLDMAQVSVETDEVRHLGLKIDLRQVASIIFFDVPLTAKADSPAPARSPDEVVCGQVKIKRPSLRGFHLGMSVEEAKAVTPTFRYIDDPNEVGEQSAFISSPGQGARSVSLEFLDGRLKKIDVTYDSSVRWNNEQEFYSRIAETFGLPSTWQGLLKCEGMNLDAEFNSGIIPQTHLYDTNARQIIRKRRADIEEKKRREFKP